MTNNYESGGQERVLPDAANLFYALRSMGYENTAAVADLIDNSIDAGAKNIRITVDNDRKIVYIADDGCGMSKDTLKTAIKLGGKKDHSDGSDLGKYGLGLITASISMGPIIRIITKHDGVYNSAVLDCNVISNVNDFIVNFYDSKDAEIQSFDYRTNNAESGTVLIIDKCDKLQYTSMDDFMSALDEKIPYIFREYLRNGNHIFLNNIDVEMKDPLLLDRGSKILVDTDITIDIDGANSAKMHVKAVEAQDYGVKINKQLRLNIAGQGFYILRNNREIATALEFQEVFKKHNDFNLLRIEINFGPDLDDLMGVNLKKHEIAPSKKILSALDDLLHDDILGVRARAKARQQKDKEKKNPFKPSKGNSAAVSEPETTSEQPSVSVPITTSDAPSKPVEYEYTFATYAGSEDEQMFRIMKSGNKIVIRYNFKNKFYADNLLAGDTDSKKMKALLDTAVKGSIEAYIKSSGDTKINQFVKDLASAFEAEK